MLTIDAVCRFLDEFAPPRLAEEWDNVGLLIGDRGRAVTKIMACLTATPASAAEAVDEGAELIVAHHPLPFRPLKRVTTDTTPGRLVWELAVGRVAVYSPHTAFDSAAAGINQCLAEGIGLTDVQPLVPPENEPTLGSGRFGAVVPSQSLADVAGRLKQFLSIESVRCVGAAGKAIARAAVACGSGGEFLHAAHRKGCDLLVTGEATFHGCLEAEALGVALLLTGHYASERFAVERLAEVLADEFPDLIVWPSRREHDPLGNL